MLRKLFYRLFALLLLGCCIYGGFAWQIWRYADEYSDQLSDVAIVLGAAVWTNRPSPVLKERLNHAALLWQQQRVRFILLTGGQSPEDELSESLAGKRYLMSKGVPADVILQEESSHTTFENMVFSKALMEQQQLHTALVVSDPLHMRRAMTMGRDLELDLMPSPTPTTRFRSLSSRLEMLEDETMYYIAYLLRRTLGITGELADQLLSEEKPG